MLLLGALPIIRKKGYFEMFYWSHLNYILFFLLYCFHSPTGLHTTPCVFTSLTKISGLLWFIFPGLMFLLYKLLVFTKLCFGYRSSLALECTALQVEKYTRIQCELKSTFSVKSHKNSFG